MNKKYLSISLSFLLVLSLVSYSSALSEYNLTYDGNGNLITGDGKYRTYNEFNQLIRIQINNSNGTVLEEYLYHPTEDRILAKNVYDETGDIKETIIYANENLIRTSTYPSANAINTSDKIYVKDETGFVAEFNPNQSKIFYHNDYLGSTGVLTNESGAIVEQTFYEPFGGIISGGNVSHFYYEGKDWSPTIDEYDFNFRKYNPDLLIFTKPDSLIKDPYKPQGLNKYSFELDNPYRYTDPDGHYIDTEADLLFIVYDLSQLDTKEGRRDWVNWVSLGVDITFAALPFATGGGPITRWGAKLADSTSKSRIVALDTISSSEKAKVFGEAGKVSQGAAEVLNKYGNTIMSYEEASSLTKGFSGEIQAHHLVESRFLSNEMCKSSSPSIILSKLQHNTITNALRQFIPYGTTLGAGSASSKIQSSYSKSYKGSSKTIKTVKNYLSRVFRRRK